jgi:hypothetical protein
MSNLVTKAASRTRLLIAMRISPIDRPTCRVVAFRPADLGRLDLGGLLTFVAPETFQFPSEEFGFLPTRSTNSRSPPSSRSV